MRIITMGLVMLSATCFAWGADDAAPLLGSWTTQIQGGGQMTLTFGSDGVLTNKLQLPGEEAKSVSLPFRVSDNTITFPTKEKVIAESRFTLKDKELIIKGGMFVKEGVLFTKLGPPDKK